MRVASWNVNSIRARLDLVLEWIEGRNPDVVCLQETKCTNEVFPTGRFEALGYEVAHHGVNHWNGVAIVSRVGIEAVQRGFRGHQEPPFDEPRFIGARCGGMRVASVYVPNGRSLDDAHYLYKLVWLERLRAELLLGGDLDTDLIVVGDFNVAPTDADIYDPSRWRRRTHASAPERAAIAALVDLGLVDLGVQSNEFTWWNYRTAPERNMGLRIDLALASQVLAARAPAIWVDVAARRTERPSDHAPVVIDFDAS